MWGEGAHVTEEVCAGFWLRDPRLTVGFPQTQLWGSLNNPKYTQSSVTELKRKEVGWTEANIGLRCKSPPQKRFCSSWLMVVWDFKQSKTQQRLRSSLYTVRGCLHSLRVRLSPDLDTDKDDSPEPLIHNLRMIDTIQSLTNFVIFYRSHTQPGYEMFDW